MDASKEQNWLGSREAKQVLRVSDCELAHRRQAGKLRFMKKGNAFLYLADDCEKQKSDLRNRQVGPSSTKPCTGAIAARPQGISRAGGLSVER